VFHSVPNNRDRLLQSCLLPIDGDHHDIIVSGIFTDIHGRSTRSSEQARPDGPIQPPFSAVRVG